MILFIEEHGLMGLTLGVFTFLIIGLFHPLVIKAEYYFGVKSWWAFLLLGLICGAGSVCARDLLVSTLLGVTAFSSFWSIHEVIAQEKRVRKGWFPANPKRKQKGSED